jgi:predicted CxxxxCH...CXXCH cytochrome family protein
MTRTLIIVPLLAFLGLSCSELKQDLPTNPGKLDVHGLGWNNPSSANFHGTALKAANFDFTECKKCHQGDFSGGTSGVSCASCHPAYPHPAGWTAAGTSTSHGVFLKNVAYVDSSCTGCHGSNYTGGTSGKSCFTCHPAYPHSSTFGSGGHQAYIEAHNYGLEECKTCHGATYSGGAVVTQGCMVAGCHVDQNGTAKSPEACNTCHGNFSSPSNVVASFAPPRALNGDTQESSPRVGAHQIHLLGTKGLAVDCAECHIVPSSITASGHIGAPPAEVVLNGSMAGIVTGDGTNIPSPQYLAGSCANTYCHGNWKLRKSSAPAILQFAYSDSVMRGANASPAWSAGASAGDCSSCHGGSAGVYVPAGHLAFGITECVACHGDVVDANGAIKNTAKHINGYIDMIDAYGTRYKMQ